MIKPGQIMYEIIPNKSRRWRCKLIAMKPHMDQATILILEGPMKGHQITAAITNLRPL
jgi:hypothetical protein